MRRFIYIFSAIICALGFSQLPLIAQVTLIPESTALLEKTFSVSKVTRADSTETLEKFNELFLLIKKNNFLNEEENVVTLLSVGVREYFADNILQRLSPTRFVIESTPRNADGTLMKVTPQKFVLDTLLTRAWVPGTKPNLKLIAKEGATIKYLAQNGATASARRLEEVSLEKLGLKEFTEKTLIAKLQDGEIFRVAEITVGADKKPVRVTWEVKW